MTNFQIKNAFKEKIKKNYEINSDEFASTKINSIVKSRLSLQEKLPLKLKEITKNLKRKILFKRNSYITKPLKINLERR